jgi:hypothetical protein
MCDNIARLSQWGGGGGYFTRSNDFYLPSLRLEEGGRGVISLSTLLILPGFCVKIR